MEPKNDPDTSNADNQIVQPQEDKNSSKKDPSTSNADNQIVQPQEDNSSSTPSQDKPANDNPESGEEDMDAIFEFVRVPTLASPFSTSSSIAPSPLYESDSDMLFRKPTPSRKVTDSPLYEVDTEYCRKRTPNRIAQSSPLHETSEFRQPTPFSPWSANRTPIHLPNLISPLPATPARSEHFSDCDNLSDSLTLTPRAERVQDFVDDNNIQLDQDQTEEKRLKPISLKKHSSNRSWSIDNHPPSENTSTKLDRVVLSLKKTAGNNWNVSKDNSSDNSDIQASPSKTEQQKAKRRSRKSTSAPIKKIPATKQAGKPEAESKKLEDNNLVLPSRTAEEKQKDEEHITYSSLAASPMTPEPDQPEKFKSSSETSNSVTKNDAKKAPKVLIKFVEPAKSESREFPVKKYGKQFARAKIKSGETCNIDNSQIMKLKNKLSMTIGLPVSISFGGEFQTHTLNQISSLTDKLPTVQETEENHEFRKLLNSVGKGVTSDLDCLNFVQKLQSSLLNQEKTDAKTVTFHVGQDKSTIDLPKDTLDVTSNKGTDYTCLLYSESDGIEGEVLRSNPELPKDNSKQFLKRRGKQANKESNAKASVIQHNEQLQQQESQYDQPAPYRFEPPVIPNEEPVIQPEQNQQQQYSPYFDFFRDQANLCMFNNIIANLMQGFYCPDHFREQGIDPVLAMLFYKLRDPSNTPESLANYQRLTELYAMSKNPAWSAMAASVSTHPDHQQQIQSVPPMMTYNIPPQFHLQNQIGEFKMPSSTRDVNNRTYIELQTVRGRETANDVLREHQTSPSGIGLSHESPIRATTPSRTPARRQTSSTPESVSSSSEDPATVKTEVMEYPSTPNSNPTSVQLSSVHPGERSVQEMAPNMPASGSVGEGKRVVIISYRNCTIGPIRVETEQEVKAVKDLVEDYMTKAQIRGQKISKGAQFYSAAEQARSILKPEIVKYVQRAFTLQGMKENTMGRKKRNYPKRSAIIKIDPKTGERLNPTANSSIVDEIKREVNDEILDEEEESENVTVTMTRRSIKTSGGNDKDCVMSSRKIVTGIERMLSLTDEQSKSNKTPETRPSIDLEDADELDMKRASSLEFTITDPDYDVDGDQGLRTSLPLRVVKKTTKAKSTENNRINRPNTRNKGLLHREKPDPSPSPIIGKLTASNLAQLPSSPSRENVNASLCPAVPPETVKESPKKASKKMYKGFVAKSAAKSAQPEGNKNMMASAPLGMSESVQKILETPSLNNVSSTSKPENSASKRDVLKNKKKFEQKSKKAPQVFVRPSQQKRLEKLMQKQEKKVLKKKKKTVYRGIGNVVTPIRDEASSKRSTKFTEAQVIGGVKRKIMPDNKVVEIISSPKKSKPSSDQMMFSPATASTSSTNSTFYTPTTKSKHSAPIAQRERDLLEELFAVAEEFDSYSQPNNVMNNVQPVSTENNFELLRDLSFGNFTLPGQPSLDDLL